MWVVLLFACTSQSLDPLLAPDATRTGTLGTDGPFGASQLIWRAQARISERIWVKGVVPVDEAGAPVSGPTVMLVQGGLVDVERYVWLARHLASRGYPVLMPWHPLDLAIFASGNAEIAYEDAVDSPPEVVNGIFEPTRAIGGHSLGGVVASMGWARDDWDGLILMASFPAASTPVEDRNGPVLSLIGSVDGSADLADVEAGADRFAGPVQFGIIDGMNHYSWTDDASTRELAGDGTATRPTAETRQDGLYVMDTWLDAVLKGDQAAAERLSEPFPGISP